MARFVKFMQRFGQQGWGYVGNVKVQARYSLGLRKESTNITSSTPTKGNCTTTITTLLIQLVDSQKVDAESPGTWETRKPETHGPCWARYSTPAMLYYLCPCRPSSRVLTNTAPSPQ